MGPVGMGEGAMHAAVVSMSDVVFRWPGAAGFSLAIDHFTLERGRKVLLLGPSGSGKSTLLSLLAGIVSPDRGRIDILGTDIAALSSGRRDRFRAEHIGVIFQMFNLLPYGSAIDNVVLPLAFAPGRRARAAKSDGVAREARRLLLALGLTEERIARTAGQLSVGQQQRVAAARALIGGPELIIADEPTSALDDDAKGRFLELLFGQLDAVGASLLMVSHETPLGEHFDEVIRLDEVIARREAA
jgi:putative ABC transport system ATP-binding protein